jgi:hypothetical protein
MQQTHQAFEAIKSYRFGQSRQPLDAVAAIVVAAVGTAHQQEVAGQLTTVLNSNATLDCKRFACRQLAIIGTPAQIDAVAPFLLDETLADMARYALQPIEGAAMDKALLAALKNAPQTPATLRIGLITTLGARGAEPAIRPLGAFAAGNDPQVARAAIAAMARIGGVKGARALESARNKVRPELQPEVSEALLAVAGALLANGAPDRAARIYNQLAVPQQPDAVRAAAFIGLAKSGGLDADAAEWHARLAQDPTLRKAAAGYLHEVAAHYTRVAERQLAR